MLIRADVEQSVGDWIEFFMYSEEIDYCRRIRERGYLAWFEPTAVVEHPGGGGGSEVYGAIDAADGQSNSRGRSS